MSNQIIPNKGPEWKEKFRDLFDNGYIRTDSDIEDFCDENGVNWGDAFQYQAELLTNGTECEGCANIGFFGSGMYPCSACIRRKVDKFQRREEIEY